MTGQRYFRGPTECILTLYRDGGLRQCYKGLAAMVVRDVPSFGLYILVYEYLFKIFQECRYADRHGALASVISGGWAGVISWGIVMPFDVIKSLMQADRRGYYRGYWDCIQKTYQRGGVRAFFAGIMVNSVRSFPTNAVIFLIYSQLLKNLNEQYDHRKDKISSVCSHLPENLIR